MQAMQIGRQGDEKNMIPDFRGADNLEVILARFVPAAKSIMLEHKLVYGDLSWSITALELYLWTGRAWCDPCTDRKLGQARHGTWYVNYGRNPNHGRIDITAGDEREIYAGLPYPGVGQERRVSNRSSKDP